VYYRAKELARENGQQYHLAAILKRKNKTIRIGTNSAKTHPAYGRKYPDGTHGYTMHAEMNVLRFAEPGDHIEVLRVSKGGDLTMAKPCVHCQRMMRYAKIRSVRYTGSDGSWETLKLYG